jgi:D-serine deaminase-like pyridoxal phosphate-dependent protein
MDITDMTSSVDGGMPGTLHEAVTPALVLDLDKATANVSRMRGHAARLGVGLRPHMKTAKSVDVLRQIVGGVSTPITVSTLKEAEVFAAAGATDMLYAVGIAPHKLPRVSAIRRTGCDLCIVIDSATAADAVGRHAKEVRDPVPALIELDADGHRAGLPATRMAEIVALGRTIHEGGGELRGVMVHAGESYAIQAGDALREAARHERDVAVAAAQALRAAGLPCPVVSVGSTPTACGAQDLSGVTELRAGVFMFYDLFMAGVGVCGLDDIALSVVATVIGHQPAKGWTLVDAGWMALSRDRGTARQAVDQGYGVVCDLSGKRLGDLLVIDASQEHGILAVRPGGIAAPALPLGTRVRILPNHACATAAQHDRYLVVQQPDPTRVTATFRRFGGW